MNWKFYEYFPWGILIQVYRTLKLPLYSKSKYVNYRVHLGAAKIQTYQLIFWKQF